MQSHMLDAAELEVLDSTLFLIQLPRAHMMHLVIDAVYDKGCHGLTSTLVPFIRVQSIIVVCY